MAVKDSKMRFSKRLRITMLKAIVVQCVQFKINENYITLKL